MEQGQGLDAHGGDEEAASQMYLLLIVFATV